LGETIVVVVLSVGDIVGVNVAVVGLSLGNIVGVFDGDAVPVNGLVVGNLVGVLDSDDVLVNGLVVGNSAGDLVGIDESIWIGFAVGMFVGDTVVGISLGIFVGEFVVGSIDVGLLVGKLIILTFDPYAPRVEHLFGVVLQYNVFLLHPLAE